MTKKSAFTTNKSNLHALKRKILLTVFYGLVPR